MSNKPKRYGVTVTELLNQCTGIMRVDEENNYLGYYTRDNSPRINAGASRDFHPGLVVPSQVLVC